MRFLERAYPYILAIISGIIFYLLNIRIDQISNFDNILSSTVTFSSIIIAFLSTMVSIFISLIDSKIMKRINAEDGDGLLTSYIAESVIGGLSLVVYSMVLFMFLNYSGKLSNYLFCVYVILLVFLILSSYRILKLTLNILRNVLKEFSGTNIEEGQEEIDRPKINPN